MIQFFRHIRQRLLGKNQFSKYLLYAFGEIILVVIGILLALQINTWNLKKIDKSKEANYLSEINENLASDLRAIDSILKFNKAKQDAITSVIQNLGQPSSLNQAQILGPNLNILGQYDIFYPNDLGFQNLISAESIGLITDNELRKRILDYYNFDFKSGTQERIETVTRNFVDYLIPIMTTQERVQQMYQVTVDIPKNEDVDVVNDQKMLSILDLMNVVMQFQNDILLDNKEKIQRLRAKISNHLEWWRVLKQRCHEMPATEKKVNYD